MADPRDIVYKVTTHFGEKKTKIKINKIKHITRLVNSFSNFIMKTKEGMNEGRNSQHEIANQEKKKTENKKTRKEGMEKITLELNLILGNIMLAAFYKHNW